MEAKLKHLEMIQSVIARMAANTFLLKGWCVTLIAGLCAIAVEADRHKVYLLAYIPIILFGCMDGYYLWLERRFRDLYNAVRIKDAGSINFDMSIAQFRMGIGGYLNTLC